MNNYLCKGCSFDQCDLKGVAFLCPKCDLKGVAFLCPKYVKCLWSDSLQHEEHIAELRPPYVLGFIIEMAIMLDKELIKDFRVPEFDLKLHYENPLF